MTFFGLSLVLILGIVNFILIVFQLGSGLRYFKVRFGVHRKTGMLLFVTATLHGLLGILSNL